jgi:glycosyltransferase involved in cell wall biosynthesis
VRIAYLISQYPFIRHAYLLREVRQLRQSGWDVRVMAVRPDDRSATQLTGEERDEAARTHYLLTNKAGLILSLLRTFVTHPAGFLRGFACALSYGRFHPIRTLYGLLYFVEAVAAGVWLESNKLRHVHTHYASTVAWILSRIFPIRISLTIHGSAEFDDIAGFRLRDKVIASEFVFAISQFGRSQILRAIPPEQWSKIEVCPLGVDPEAFPLAEFRRNPEFFELLSAGGMATPRAFQFLVESAAILAAGGRHFVLRLVGDGPDRPLLERLAAELGVTSQVVFEGWKNQDELRALYARADLFVFSSFAEGLPVVLMEAMAQGIPCVAPRITGIPELIEDGVEGFLVTVADERDMAQKIERLMDDPDLRSAMRIAARRKIEAKYDNRANTRALAEAFERRLGSC